MATRILILIACFLSASAYIARASKIEPVVMRESLTRMPLQIGAWQGRDVAIDQRTLGVLRLDDYLNRIYDNGPVHVGIYIGFYQTQRQGATMHSPLNCLPGAGWNPVKKSYLHVPVAVTAAGDKENIQINRILIQKGIERQIALYWYQAHRRVIANEYWGKIYTVLDAMRMNRTDGAIVRIISPVAGTDPSAEETAEKRGVDFIQSIYPLLSRHLPD